MSRFASRSWISRRRSCSCLPFPSPSSSFALPRPVMYSLSGTTHGTPYDYDSHVPIIFMGAGIKPGKYLKAASPNDIAPTLANLLDVEIPSGSSGRILDEMLLAGF